MATYGITTSIGSSNYGGYLNSLIIGPLSTNQFPCAMPYHSYGTLNGIRPTPPQFLPSQDPVFAEENTNARQQYLRTNQSVPEIARQRFLGKFSSPMASYSFSTGKHTPISTHMNYIVPPPSSMYTNILKSKAIGKTVYKVGLPIEAPISTKCYYPSGTRTSLRRTRSGGCVAPKKKGAIENFSLRNGEICGWGSIPKQNY